MKVKFLFFCFSFWIVSYSFSQEVLFLNPLFTEESAILAPAAEGKWIFPDINMTISIQKAGDNFYLLSYGSEKNPSTFEAVFVRINNEYFMDMSGAFPHRYH